VKYPDGSTSGGDNVQLAYHTDGTLSEEKGTGVFSRVVAWGRMSGQ
jgi:hypothetical protein